MKTFRFMFTAEAYASVEVDAEDVDKATEMAYDIATNRGLEWEIDHPYKLDVIDIYDWKENHPFLLSHEIDQNVGDSVLKYETQISLGDM